jgi:hypothetical protein
MEEMPMDTPPEADDFDIAKAISEKLRGLPKEKKERILRWVAEGIGLNFQFPASQGGVPTPGVQPTGSGPVQTLPSGGSDIKSFVASKAPKSDQQFAATVAYYYRFEAPPVNRRNLITGDVLQEAARLTGRNRFGNPTKTLNNAKQAGYLDSASPGEFALNSVGENLVAMTLPGGTDINGKKASKPRKGQRKKGQKRTR